MCPVETLLQQVLPHVSPEGRALLAVLARDGGRLAAAAARATQVGFANRHQLARCLTRDGLPPVQELAGWVSVIAWIFAWESRGTSLFRSAIESHREPATCYRTVKRITGVSWRVARQRGLPWILLKFRDRCAGPAVADWEPQFHQRNDRISSPGSPQRFPPNSAATGTR